MSRCPDCNCRECQCGVEREAAVESAESLSEIGATLLRIETLLAKLVMVVGRKR